MRIVSHLSQPSRHGSIRWHGQHTRYPVWSSGYDIALSWIFHRSTARIGVRFPASEFFLLAICPRVLPLSFDEFDVASTTLHEFPTRIPCSAR